MELELHYSTTKGEVRFKEEERYLIYRLKYYGMMTDNIKSSPHQLARHDREGGRSATVASEGKGGVYSSRQEAR